VSGIRGPLVGGDRLARAWSPARLLLVVGLPFGLLVAFLQPAWLGQDESVHFPRAWQMAGGDLTEERTADGLSSRVPVEYLDDLAVVASANAEAVGAGRGPTLDGYGRILGHRPTSGETALVPTWATDIASPVPYLPAAVAMAPLRAVDAPAVWQLWAGRLGSLAAYLGLALMALRVADRWRWTIAGMALFPPLLVQGATVGYDAVTFGALFLLVGAVSRIGRRPDRDVVAVLAVAGLLLALSKPPYHLLLWVPGACLLVGRRFRLAAACLVPAVVGLFWSVVLAPGFDDPVETLAGLMAPDPDGQVRRILGDPLGFLWEGVGGVLASLPADHLPDWIAAPPSTAMTMAAWAGLVGLVVCCLASEDGARSTGERLGALAGVGLVLAATCAAEFTYFTNPLPSGAPSDFGGLTPEWRYLAPLVGLALLAAPRLPRIPPAAGTSVVAGATVFSAIVYVASFSGF